MNFTQEIDRKTKEKEVTCCNDQESNMLSIENNQHVKILTDEDIFLKLEIDIDENGPIIFENETDCDQDCMLSHDKLPVYNENDTNNNSQITKCTGQSICTPSDSHNCSWLDITNLGIDLSAIRGMPVTTTVSVKENCDINNKDCNKIEELNGDKIELVEFIDCGANNSDCIISDNETLPNNVLDVLPNITNDYPINNHFPLQTYHPSPSFHTRVNENPNISEYLVNENCPFSEYLAAELQIREECKINYSSYFKTTVSDITIEEDFNVDKLQYSTEPNLDELYKQKDNIFYSCCKPVPWRFGYIHFDDEDDDSIQVICVKNSECITLD